VVAKAGHGVEWESWNEPDGIGGMHLGSELTAAAKVFTLAARSVYPDVTVGMGGANAGKAALTEAMDKNGYLSAIDAYIYHNHSDIPIASDKRRMLDPYTGNRPVWVSEYSYGAYPCQPKNNELTPDSELRLATDIPKIFARGTHDGNERIYYFTLLAFGETANCQWGVLRNDLQPRPGYLTLAACGRLLAGAVPAGAINDLPKGAEGWSFLAKPDGQDKAVAILWKNTGNAVEWQLPGKVTAYDLWGRQLNASKSINIGTEAVFCVFNRQDLENWKITPPRQRPSLAKSDAKALCPVVADFRLPERYKNNPGDFFIFTQSEVKLDFDIYNFAPKSLRGTWHVEAPSGYSATIIEHPGELLPNDRRKLQINLKMTTAWSPDANMIPVWLRLRGDYDQAGESIIAIRFVNCPADRPPEHVYNIPGALNGTKWKPNAAQGTTLKTTQTEGWLNFNIAAGPAPNHTIGTTWAAPLYRLEPTEKCSSNTWGISIKIRNIEAPPGTVLALNVIKKNGAAWTCPLPINTIKNNSSQGVRLILPFSWFAHISYRAPDPEGKLSATDIVGIELVSIALPDSTVKFDLSAPSWVSGAMK